MCESFTHLAYYLVERFIAVWEGQHKHTQFGSWCLLMASVVKCWLIYPQSTLWPTLDRPLMNTPSTQYQHSISTPSTPWLPLDWHSIDILVDSWSRVNSFLINAGVGWRLSNYWLTVDQVLIRCQSSLQSSVDEVST